MQGSRRRSVSLCRFPCHNGSWQRSLASQAPSQLQTSDTHWLGDLDAHRQYIERVGHELGIKELSDWYKVPRAEVKKVGGKQFFGKHESLFQTLRTVYPQHPWRSIKFVNTGWDDPLNQRRLLDRIGRSLGVKEPADWYSIKRSSVTERGGAVLFTYHASLEDALKIAYPDFNWESPRFLETGRVPAKYWKNKSHLDEALDKAEQTLGIKQPEDWYSVTLTDLTQVGLFPRGISKLQLAELLGAKYPDYQWDKMVLLRGRYAEQKRLEKAIEILFPETDIIFNARKEAKLRDPETKDLMELDIFIPSLNLAFEYQDKHHFTASDFNFRPLEKIKQRDAVKSELAAQQGISLITIPCWWDCRKESLIATIRQRRPDLLGHLTDEADKPIPKDIPSGFFDKRTPHIEDIGQPSLACFFTLSSVNPTNWWMFEKYDGTRGFWNPLKKGFYSRFGNKFAIPKEIVDDMPSDVFLDGELWFGRENFQEALKMSRTLGSEGVDWPSFKYMVFDVPNHSGNYQERYSHLVSTLKERPYKFIELAETHVCKGMEHMETFFQDVIDKGGEGIILRDPLAPYQPGRSAGYLKHKRFRDSEAKVVGNVGQYQWECELPNGLRFTASAGTSEFAKRWQPVPGDIVSFKHRGFLMGTKKPKLPTLYRIRKDLTWDDVITNWKEQKGLSIPESPFKRSRSKNGAVKPKGYWREREHQRQYLIEFAESMGFDPLVPENWKNITKTMICSRKGHTWLGTTTLKKALQSAFPELQFTDIKERTVWDPSTCRQFFDEYAKEVGRDPTMPTTWYLANLSALVKRTGGDSIYCRYSGFKRALKAAYPEVQFTRWEKSKARSKWADVRTCREYLDSLAAEKGFDPSDVKGWYSLRLKKLSSRTGIDSMRNHHKGLRNAIQFAYPELKFALWK